MIRSILSKITSPESLLFLTIFTCAVYFSEIAYQTSNYTSRLFLTEAIVDHQTLSLDDYEERLGVDYAVYDGRLYSDKPPGSSLLMLPQYLLIGKPIKWLFDLLDLNIAVQNQDYSVQDVFAGWLVQIFSLGLYSAVSFIALYRILGLFNVTNRFLLCLLTYFATLIFAYSTIGTGEMFTVPPLLIGLYYLLKSRFAEPENANYIWAGFWYGLAFFVTNQVLLLIAAAALALYWSTRQIRPVLSFLLPCLGFALLTMGYNWLLFDHPLHFPQQYWIQGDPQVVLFGWPNLLNKIPDMLILPRKGLLFYSPYLILSIPGLAYLYRHMPGEKRFRQSIVFLFAGSFLAYFVFYLFNLGWAGGADFGFRYMVIVTPFLAIPAAVWLDKRPKPITTFQKLTTVFLVVWSVGVCAFGAVTDPEVPTGVPNPLIDYTWPRFLVQATNNVPNLLLEQLFDITAWPLRFATTLLFFAALALLLYRTRTIWQKPT